MSGGDQWDMVYDALEDGKTVFAYSKSGGYIGFLTKENAMPRESFHQLGAIIRKQSAIMARKLQEDRP